jgi:hypothetical protein
MLVLEMIFTVSLDDSSIHILQEGQPIMHNRPTLHSDENRNSRVH